MLWDYAIIYKCSKFSAMNTRPSFFTRELTKISWIVFPILLFVLVFSVSVVFVSSPWQQRFSASPLLDVTTGLVGYWNFDEGSGTVAGDSSGSGNNGTLVNGPAWTIGKIGTALSFNGANQYVTVPYTTDNTVTSISLWMKPTTYANSCCIHLLAKNSVGGGSVFTINRSSSPAGSIAFTRSFSITSGEWVTPASVAPVGSWHHIVVTYDSSSVANNPAIYVDGVSQSVTRSQAPAGTATTNSTKGLLIATGSANTANANPEFFNGAIDDVRIYNRTFSAGDVSTLYSTGTVAPPPVSTTGTIYYVATNGLDTNSGTITSPFKTLAKALTAMKGGDTLYIRGGTYTGAGYSTGIGRYIPSGTSWSSVTTISGYPGEVAILQPAKEQLPGGVWTCGIDFEAGNVLKISDQYIVIQNLIVDGSGCTSVDNGIYFYGGNDTDTTWAQPWSQHIRIQSVEVRNWGSLGIQGGGSDIQIVASSIHDNGLGSALDPAIKNGAHGIYWWGQDSLFDGLDVYRNADVGIQLNDSHTGASVSRNIIRNNRVHDNGLSITLGIPTVNDSGTGIVVDGSDNQIYNNIVYNGTEDGIDIGYSPGSYRFKVYNNTFYSNKGFGINLGTFGAADNGFLENNIVYGNGVAIQNNGLGNTLSNNLTTDPKFVNAAAFDFHLQSTSLAINRGVSTAPYVTTDFDGITRPQGSAYDIGAYEYVAAYPTPYATPYATPYVTPVVNLTNVTFTPLLQGRNTIPAGTSFTLNFYTPGTTTLKATAIMASDASGKLTFPSSVVLATGNYDILTATNGYLKKKQLNVALASNTTLALAQLTAGDFNSDNAINSLDWSVMNTQWFSNNAQSDINGDGIVNSLDFSYLNSNWNKAGD